MLLAEPLIATLFQYRSSPRSIPAWTALSVYGLSFGCRRSPCSRWLLPAFYARRTQDPGACRRGPRWWPHMVFNFALLAVLYQVMVPDALKAQG